MSNIIQGNHKDVGNNVPNEIVKEVRKNEEEKPVEKSLKDEPKCTCNCHCSNVNAGNVGSIIDQIVNAKKGLMENVSLKYR